MSPVSAVRTFEPSFGNIFNLDKILYYEPTLCLRAYLSFAAVIVQLISMVVVSCQMMQQTLNLQEQKFPYQTWKRSEISSGEIVVLLLLLFFKMILKFIRLIP